MTQVPIIAIDGPGGSGKGTIARRVARHFGWHLLDSGALYRLVALAGLRAGLDPDDAAGHARLATELDVQFGMDPAGEERVLLRGEDVTRELRAEATGEGGVPGRGVARRAICPVGPPACLCAATRPGGRRTGHGLDRFPRRRAQDLPDGES